MYKLMESKSYVVESWTGEIKKETRVEEMAGTSVKILPKSYRRPKFKPQWPPGDSQPYVTLVPGDAVPFFLSSMTPHMQVMHMHTCRQTHIHRK